MKKQVGLFVLTAILSGGTVMTAQAAGWQQNNAGWWWQEDNGTYPANQWRDIDGKWYYFGGDGYMSTNCWVDGKYYVGSDGAMLADTTTPDGYKVGADGVWISDAEISNQKNGEFDYTSLAKDVMEAKYLALLGKDKAAVEAVFGKPDSEYHSSISYYLDETGYHSVDFTFKDGRVVEIAGEILQENYYPGDDDGAYIDSIYETSHVKEIYGTKVSYEWLINESPTVILKSIGKDAAVSIEGTKNTQTQSGNDDSCVDSDISIYNNKINHQALAVYKKALKTDPDFKWGKRTWRGDFNNYETSFGLFDLNQDGVYEMEVYVMGPSNAATTNWFCWYADGKIHKESLQIGTLYYRPKESKFVSLYAHMGMNLDYFEFDGHSVTKESEFFELEEEYVKFNGGDLEENRRLSEKFDSFVEGAILNSIVDATEENLNYYLSGNGKMVLSDCD